MSSKLFAATSHLLGCTSMQQYTHLDLYSHVSMSVNHNTEQKWPPAAALHTSQPLKSSSLRSSSLPPESLAAACSLTSGFGFSFSGFFLSVS